MCAHSSQALPGTHTSKQRQSDTYTHGGRILLRNTPVVTTVWFSPNYKVKQKISICDGNMRKEAKRPREKGGFLQFLRSCILVGKTSCKAVTDPAGNQETCITAFTLRLNGKAGPRACGASSFLIRKMSRIHHRPD